MARNSTDVLSSGLGGAFGDFFRERSEDIQGLGRGTAAIPEIVSDYAQETTAAEKAEDVVGFGKGMAEAIADDPLTFIAESLPIYGQYAAVRDSNELLGAAEEARGRGDEEGATNLEALAATAMLGIIPIGGGFLRAGARGARGARSGIETLPTGPKIEQPPVDETPPGIMSIDFDEDGQVIGGEPPDPLANILLEAADTRYINGFDPLEIVPGRAFESGIPSSGILGAMQKKQSKKGVRMTLDDFDNFVEGYGLSRGEINDLKTAARQATTLSKKGNEVVDSYKLADILPALDTSNRMWVSGKINLPGSGPDRYAHGADNAEQEYALRANPQQDEQRVLTLNSASPNDMAQGITATARVSSQDSDINAVNNALQGALQNILNEPEIFATKSTEDIFNELRISNLGLPDHYRNFVNDTLDDADLGIREAINDLKARTSYMGFLTRPGRENVLKNLPDDNARRSILEDAYMGDFGAGPTIEYRDSMNFLTQDSNLGAGANDPGRTVDPTQVLTLPEDMAVMTKFADHQMITTMRDFVEQTLDDLNQFENSTDPNIEQVRQDTEYFRRPRLSYEEFKGRYDRELARLQAEENSTGKVQSYDMDNLITLPDPVSRVMDRWDEVQINSRGYDEVSTYDPDKYDFQDGVDSVAETYRQRARAEEQENPALQATTLQARRESDRHDVFRTTDDWSAKHVAGFVRTDANQIIFQPNKTYGPEDIGKDVLINRTIAEQAINQPAAPWAGSPMAGVLDGRSVLELQNDLRGNAQKDNHGTVKDGKVLRAADKFVRGMEFVTDPGDEANYLPELNSLPKASEAQALLSPNLNALKSLASPHRYTETNNGIIESNVYTDLIDIYTDSPDVNIRSLLKEIDNDNAKNKGQSPYFKDLRAIREGLEAVDKLRDNKGVIGEGKVTAEFFDEHLAAGAPFREALTRIRDLYPVFSPGAEARNFVKLGENPVHYFTDARLNILARSDPDGAMSSNIGEAAGRMFQRSYGGERNMPHNASAGFANRDKQLHSETYRLGEEVDEPFEGYARDAIGTQKKLIKAAIVDAIRQGNNAITLPGVMMKDNPDFRVDIPEDGGVNPKRVVDRSGMQYQQGQHPTSSGLEQDKSHVYTGMWDTAQSLVEELNADMKKTGKPGKFTAVLAPTGRLDGKLDLDESRTGINIAMRIRPVIYWTPDTQEKMKFRKGGLVTIPGKRYEPGLEAVIRKYRREGVMD